MNLSIRPPTTTARRFGCVSGAKGHPSVILSTSRRWWLSKHFTLYGAHLSTSFLSKEWSKKSVDSRFAKSYDRYFSMAFPNLFPTENASNHRKLFHPPVFARLQAGRITFSSTQVTAGDEEGNESRQSTSWHQTILVQRAHQYGWHSFFDNLVTTTTSHHLQSLPPPPVKQ